jgi:hypothetical protein
MHLLIRSTNTTRRLGLITNEYDRRSEILPYHSWLAYEAEIFMDDAQLRLGIIEVEM